MTNIDTNTVNDRKCTKNITNTKTPDINDVNLISFTKNVTPKLHGSFPSQKDIATVILRDVHSKSEVLSIENDNVEFQVEGEIEREFESCSAIRKEERFTRDRKSVV